MLVLVRNTLGLLLIIGLVILFFWSYQQKAIVSSKVQISEKLTSATTISLDVQPQEQLQLLLSSPKNILSLFDIPAQEISDNKYLIHLEQKIFTGMATIKGTLDTRVKDIGADYQFSGQISIKSASNAFIEPKPIEATISTHFVDEFVMITAQVTSPFIIAAYNDPRTWAIELAIKETQNIFLGQLLREAEKNRI